MPSFDVVNRLDFQEIDNAIGNAIREITNRYDFKGSDTTIERKENDLIVITDDELKVNQVHDLIITHLVRRKVDPLCISKSSLEKAGGNKVSQSYKFVDGIICISKMERNDLLKLYPKYDRKICIINNPSPLELLNKKLRIKK